MWCRKLATASGLSKALSGKTGKWRSFPAFPAPSIRTSASGIDEINDIIEEYEGYINEKVASGKSQEEAIDDFGDFDELVKEILSAYKINENYEDNIKQKNVLSDFIDSSVSFIKDFVKNIGSRSKDDVIIFIFEFIILIIFIAILKLPVLLIEEI